MGLSVGPPGDRDVEESQCVNRVVIPVDAGALSSAITNPLDIANSVVFNTPRLVELFIHRHTYLRRWVLLIDLKGNNLALAKIKQASESRRPSTCLSTTETGLKSCGWVSLYSKYVLIKPTCWKRYYASWT